MAYEKEHYVVGAHKAAFHLRSVGVQLNGFEEPFEEVGKFYRNQIRQQFAGHGALIGVSGPWHPLKGATVVYKKEHKFDPLIYTGELLNSWTNRMDLFNISKVGKEHASFGTSNPLAHFHQSGTHDAKAGIHIPARPVVMGNEVLDQVIVHSISQHLFRLWV